MFDALLALVTSLTPLQYEIQQLYSVHRAKRNTQQNDKFLSPDFSGLAIDQTLLRLERPEVEPGFRDERHCLVLWARPPEHVIQLAAKLQSLLKDVAPGTSHSITKPLISFRDCA